MKRLLHTLTFTLLLLSSCSKVQPEELPTPPPTPDPTNPITLSFGSSVATSIEQSSLGKSEPSTTPTSSSINAEGNSCLLAFFDNREQGSFYPNKAYGDIYGLYNSTQSEWQFGFSTTANTTSAITLGVNPDLETLHISAVCYNSIFSSSEYSRNSSITDITRIAVASPATVCNYVATYDLPIVQETKAYNVDLLYKPTMAKFTVNIGLEHEQSGITLSELLIYNSDRILPEYGWLNCATNTLTFSQMSNDISLLSQSIALSTTPKTSTRYLIPFELISATKVIFKFNGRDTSFENKIDLGDLGVTAIEAGKSYTLNVTLDNYGRFDNVTIDSSWDHFGEDIGSSI